MMHPRLKIALAIVTVACVLAVMALVVRSRLGSSGLMPAVTLPGISLPGADGKLPVLADHMPEFTHIESWLNSDPLTADSLKGKVVLVDFWTYSCINCIRTLPYVTAWHEKYKGDGFTVIGVHTPEFAFEKEAGNVRDAIKRYGITYPVALDNSYGTWNAYNNSYWPAHYLFDAQGKLRYTHFGEGDYDVTEKAIRSLIAEAGAAMPTGDTTEVPSDVQFNKIGSPETYVGYERQEGFESPEAVKQDAVQQYSIPAKPRVNHFSLAGEWIVGGEFATLSSSSGAIAYRYDAGSANLVMGAPKPVRAEVTLDGAPVPKDFRGADITEENGRTYVTIDGQRLYVLTDGHGSYGQHLLRIDFQSAGVQCYAFTFG